MGKRDSLSIAIILALVILDFFLWREILFVHPTPDTELYFLDVGQGDSELLILPGGVKVLTDAGPERKIIASLEKVLPPQDRYIDLAVISHPQKDHFNGFYELLARYTFGAIVTNGREGETPEWRALITSIEARKIPLIALHRGDRIVYRENSIEILSPDSQWLQSGELNDTGIVALVDTPEFRTLLTADIGANVEEDLVRDFDLRADILKVGHHGSKYSSSKEFLEAVSPTLAVIEVGENRYGHPTEETLRRLSVANIARVFRTDRDGTVKVIAQDKRLKIFIESR